MSLRDLLISILEAGEITVGLDIRVVSGERFVTIEGGGLEAALAPPLARRALGILEEHWGPDDAVVIDLRRMLPVAEAGQ